MLHEVENRFTCQWTKKYNFWWVVALYTCQLKGSDTNESVKLLG